MEVRKIGRVTVTRLDQDYNPLDVNHVLEAEQQLLAIASAADPPLFVLDLTHTEFIGSSFLEMLFRIWKRLSSRSGKLVLAALQPFCQEVVQLARLDTLWPMYPTVEEAVAALEQQP